jgi:hypothetical protein
MQLSGVVSQEELRAGNIAIAEMIEDAPNGLFLVRDGRDLRGLDLSPGHISRLSSWLQSPKFAGMILFSSPDSLHLEATGEIVARMKKVRTEGASTRAEVHQRLLEFDPSLADHLPELDA